MMGVPSASTAGLLLRYKLPVMVRVGGVVLIRATEGGLAAAVLLLLLLVLLVKAPSREEQEPYWLQLSVSRHVIAGTGQGSYTEMLRVTVAVLPKLSMAV